MVYIEWGPTDCEENDHKHKHPDGSSTGCQSPDLKVFNLLYMQSDILSRDPTEGDCSFIYAYSISRPSEVTTVFSV